MKTSKIAPDVTHLIRQGHGIEGLAQDAGDTQGTERAQLFMLLLGSKKIMNER